MDMKKKKSTINTLKNDSKHKKEQYIINETIWPHVFSDISLQRIL